MESYFLKLRVILSILSFLCALNFIFRGLRNIKSGFPYRFIAAISCLVSCFALFSGILPEILLMTLGSLFIIAACLVIGLDYAAGFLKKIRSAFIFGRNMSEVLDEYLIEVCKALDQLARKKIGALIIIERNESLKSLIDTGLLFDAQVRHQILIALFSIQSPVHDGAVIISSGRIKCVRSILSLKTQSPLPLGFGTRHRSALGITEKSDAIALVVSEERGQISVGFRGMLVKVNTTQELYRLISRALKGKAIATEVLKVQAAT